ncbi:MAG TPA: carboxymuconolactone decarboxylase family protein, partial [Acidimicrobiales bacterium]|nr:carboxymuconolactone decarboxylase family protein [Acidimicrobiales bacterium]
MTWLRDLPPGESEWDRVSAVAPEALAALIDLHKVAGERVDPETLELCRLRMATLLRFEAARRVRSRDAIHAGLTEEKVTALPSWPTSPAFSPAERACLALAEQFVIDVSGVTDDLVDAVLDHLSPEACYGLVNALWVFEALQSLCLTLGVEPDPESLAMV